MDRPLSVGIRDPLILKMNDLALLTDQDGDIPGEAAGLGLFFRDTCYLAAYHFRLHGRPPFLLMASDELGDAARLSLSNRAVETANGNPIDTHKIDINRTLRLGEDGWLLTDAIEIANACAHRICLPLSLGFSTVFENMFALRGASGLSRGELRAPAWDGRELLFAYDGADDVRRTLTVSFSHTPVVGPRTSEQTTAFFQFDLDHAERETLSVSMRIGETRSPRARAKLTAAAGGGEPDRGDAARLTCSDRELSRLMRRSLADLTALGVHRGDERFTAAGLPWFLALFGRDSLIPGIQSLAFDPDICADGLRALAARQGVRDDERTAEAPGKILHEWRVGEAANLFEVQQTPSFFAIDVTLLFLVAISRHAAWTGDLTLFTQMRGNVDRALAWLRREEAASPLGYLAYSGQSANGAPINQAWRDSDDGVLRADGAYPEPPLALIEVQGYAFQARRLIAGLLRRVGEADAAARLETEADDLARRFERDFWIEDAGCYCLALEAGGMPVTSIASNAAQVLWTGIAQPDRARRVAQRMMRPDMFSGWGVRTLSVDHPRYDPLAYQQGSVWPFDTSLIISGFRRYGLDEPAERLCEATLAVARRFPNGRLPEFIGGNSRLEGSAPTKALRADPMQAWSSGALPFILTEMLGLEPDGFAHRLTVRRPRLPAGVDWLRIDGLRLGGAVLTLKFRREGSRVVAEADMISGEARIITEDQDG